MVRYPGPHKHERLARRVLLGAALLIFVFGLQAVATKYRLVDLPTVRTAQARLQPNPTPTFDAVTLLRIIDETTGQPLANQSVAFMVTGNCQAGAACPASSPLVFTATADGQVAVPQPILRERPKIYVTGFAMDNYFAFLSQDNRNELTLYKSVGGAKLVYDITREVVPVWLAPAR